jgi:hypothetical protein
MFRLVSRSVTVTIFLALAGVLSAVAQGTRDSGRLTSRDTIHTSLDRWVESRRLFVLDRAHSVGDRPYDRGIFRHVAPNMDREYAQELFAFRFPSEAARYRPDAQNRLLVSAGSIRRDLFAFTARMRSQIPLGTKHTLALNIDLREDVQTSRALLEIGYKWQVSQNHALGVRHTFSKFKYDSDLSVFYGATSPTFGSAEVEWTFQDLYSDLIYQSLGISSGDLDVIRDYVRHPYLLSVSYASPDRFPLRGELVGGIQPLSRALFESQSTPEYRYRDDRRARFFGALLEYRHASITGGLFFKSDVSWLGRTGKGEQVSSDYTARQQLRRYGVFLRGKWGPVRAGVRGFRGSYRDRQKGSDYSTSLLPQKIDYEEGQRGLKARLLYEPEAGFTTGIMYGGLFRVYDEKCDAESCAVGNTFAPWTGQFWGLGPDNHGVFGLFGYRFSQGKFIMGMGLDLDGDNDHPESHPREPPSRSYFDGGFGRLILTW